MHEQLSGNLRRCVVVAVLLLVLAAVGVGGAARQAAITIGGLLMFATFSFWASRSPRSYGRFFRRSAAIVGGPPGQSWPWRRRTRGCVLVAIGIFGFPSAMSVINSPGKFAGGRPGGIAFAVGSVAALVVGVELIRSPHGR
jgi:hypothetical protein